MAAVSSTTLPAGAEALISVPFTMHAGMEGQHEFRVLVRSNDPIEPEKALTILSNWVP